MPTPVVTLEGNITADPELRFLPSGKAIANFTIACTDSKKEGDTWVDGDKLFVRVNAWEQLGENVAESLHKGDAVVVTGKLFMRDWEDKEGGKRQSLECRAYTVSAQMKRATVTINKATRGSASKAAEDPWATAEDPWATAPAAPGEPPF